MKFLTLLAALLLGAVIGAVSIARIDAQTPVPQQTCPGYGMMGGQGHGYMMNGQGNGMMNGGQGYGMMQGMHGAADQAYMQSMYGMHQSMRGRSFTGDADHDFLSMMIPQHQAAMHLARTELQYGKNAKVRALAQQMLKTQQAEIDRMSAMLR